MEEFETSIYHVQTEPEQKGKKHVISTMEEGKSRDYIMPGREKTESLCDCMRCLNI